MSFTAKVLVAMKQSRPKFAQLLGLRKGKYYGKNEVTLRDVLLDGYEATGEWAQDTF